MSFGKYYSSGELGQEVDEPESLSTRGETWNGVLTFFTSGLLRVGFLLQLLTIVIGCFYYIGVGGSGIFTSDLFSTPEALRNNPSYIGTMIMLESASLLGSMSLAGFQIFVSDNAKQTRGFRAGSKMLCTAATLDIFVGALRLMQYFYAYNYLGNRWWLKYIQSPSDWCLFYSSALLHSVTLGLYGMAIFYMDSYYGDSNQGAQAWPCLILFKIAGIFELLLAFSRFGALTTVFQVFAFSLATCWSCGFEQTVLAGSSPFHDRNVNTGILSDEASTRVPSSAASVVL